MNATADRLAGELLEVVPAAMRLIREQMRGYGASELSVPQFRALAFLDRHPGASLTELGAHIGLTLPSMSKLVDGLVERGLVKRDSYATDRRRITLGLTESGHSVLSGARDSTRAYLAALLSTLGPEERLRIHEALSDLAPLVASTKHKAVALNRGGNGHS